MLIKQQALHRHLQQGPMTPLYFLIGQDIFSLMQALDVIKQTWLLRYPDSEEIRLAPQQDNDYEQLCEMTQNYSLFAQQRHIDVRYDKKTLCDKLNQVVTEYLNTQDSHSLMIIQAPFLPLKALQKLTPLKIVNVVQTVSLTAIEVREWIETKLLQHQFSFDKQVIELIYFYTQGNMLATAQALEKITLRTEKILTPESLKQDLFDAAHFQLFELIEFCLTRNAVALVRQFQSLREDNKEATLILWMLAQEIRKRLHLLQLMQQSLSFNQACEKLNIWTKQRAGYQTALHQLSQTQLVRLLRRCQSIDMQIKSALSLQAWHAMEQVALSLCLGQWVGPHA